MSFFQKKQTLNSPKKENLFSDDTIVIRTMEDDLQDLRNGIVDEPKPSAPQAQEPANTPNQESQEGSSLGQNPFITSYQNKIASGSNPSPFAMQSQNTPTDIPETEIPSENTGKNIGLIVMFIVLILILVGGGWFYFSTTRNTEVTTTTTPQPTQNTSNTTTTTPQGKPVQTFSAATPNYLPIDTQNATQSDIKTLLTKTAAQADELHSAKPIEFFITDTNNNPVSFETFAKISGIQISPEIQSLLGNNFSLFVFSDINTPFLGIAIDTKDNDAKIKEALMKNESSLISWFKPLMINTTSFPEHPIFSDAAYLNTNIRFFNIDTINRSSFDYAVYKKKLIIGTSKTTIRSIIDKIQF